MFPFRGMLFKSSQQFKVHPWPVLSRPNCEGHQELVVSYHWGRLYAYPPMVWLTVLLALHYILVQVTSRFITDVLFEDCNEQFIMGMYLEGRWVLYQEQRSFFHLWLRGQATQPDYTCDHHINKNTIMLLEKKKIS